MPTEGRTFGVLGGRIWRLADLGAKHAFLVAGLGWGHMPLPIVAADLAAGRLVRIKLEGPQPMIMTMHAIYRLDTRTRRPMADQRVQAVERPNGKTTAAEILANPATRRRQVTMTVSLNPLRSTR